MNSKDFLEQIVRFKAYCNSLQYATTPKEFYQKEILEECTKNGHLEIYYHIVFINTVMEPLFEFYKKVGFRQLDKVLANCSEEQIGYPKADCHETFAMLSLAIPCEARQALLALNDGEAICHNFLEGESAFCKYVIENHSNLGGVSQWAYQASHLISTLEIAPTLDIESATILTQHNLEKIQDEEFSQLMNIFVSNPQTAALDPKFVLKMRSYMLRGIARFELFNEEQQILDEILSREKEIPAEYFEQFNEEEGNETEPESKANSTQLQYKRLGVPVDFRSLLPNQQSRAIELLYAALFGGFISISLDDFKFLLSSENPDGEMPMEQPFINWVGGNQQDMRACFHALFEKEVLANNKECYKFNGEPISMSKDWSKKNIDSYIKAHGEGRWEDIIFDCKNKAKAEKTSNDY